MDVNRIKCPNCGHRIDLSREMTALVAEQSKQEAAKVLEGERKRSVEESRRAVRVAVEKALNTERVKAGKEQAKLEKLIREADKKAERARKEAGKEAEKRAKAHAEEKARLRLEKQKAELEKSFMEKQKQSALEKAEVEKKLQDTRHRLQEAELKAQTGSAQSRGIIAEEDLYQYLKGAMPADRCTVEKRGQGKKGTDVIVHVHKDGEELGSIIIDDKWAGSWSNEWPEKIWKDMQDHNADFAYVAVNATAFPKGNDELKSAGFGVAPCRRSGVVVWVVDRSNPGLVLGVLMDTAEKIRKMAELKALYGSGSKAVKKFQEYLASGYETDLRDKAKHMSAAVEALSHLRRQFEKQQDKAMKALESLWRVEKRVFDSVTSCFGAEAVKSLPRIEFDKDD